MLIHEDRLFPAEPDARKIARALYAQIKGLPIVSPHGHTQAAWFAKNEPFPDPAKLFVQPDHYVFRMLYSQGVSLDDLEIGQAGDEGPAQGLAHLRQPLLSVSRHAHAHLAGFRLPGAFWAGGTAVGEDRRPLFRYHCRKTADAGVPAPRPLRAIQHGSAGHHRFSHSTRWTITRPFADSGWKARIMPTFRPDPVVDPEFKGFAENIAKLGEQTGEDTATWSGYLKALRKARPASANSAARRPTTAIPPRRPPT